jgi:hypothetical protein
MSVRWTAALLIVVGVVAPTVPAQNPPPAPSQSLQRKMQELQERIQKWQKEGRAGGSPWAGSALTGAASGPSLLQMAASAAHRGNPLKRHRTRRSKE